MPWGIAANYASPRSFQAELFPERGESGRSGTAAPLAPLAPMLAEATSRWGGAAIGLIRITHPGDAAATVTVTRSAADTIGARGATVTFAGASGEVLFASAEPGAAAAVESTMVGLHAGRFAGIGLRWFYVLSGLGGTAMVGTGLVLWTAKRRARLPDPTRPPFGMRLVERLNIGVIAGLPAGIAAYFLANRLLPTGLADRAAREIDGLFLVWGASLLWSAVRPARRGWIEMLTVAAALFAAVPLVNAATTPRNPIASLLHGDLLFLGFDLAMVALAACFLFAARRVARTVA
jgi:uncharacterized iron-regulated membrane protein